jgi:hypothetical protein
MIDLEAALFDLGEHLDHPAGADLVAAVERRLHDAASTSTSTTSTPIPDAERGDGPDDQRSRAWLVAVAAALVIALVGLAAFRPSREAIASWFGIGAVEIRQVPAPAPTGTDPPSSASSTPGRVDASTQAPDRTLGTGTQGTLDPEAVAAIERTLAELQGHLAFRIRVPDRALAPIPSSIALDDRPPGGLVELRYEDFSLVEVASQAGASPVIVKEVGPGVGIEATAVGGHEAYWLSGDPHQVAYRNREGLVRTDTVRRAGNVLVWADGDVTYRIEGARDLATAQAIAASLH